MLSIFIELRSFVDPLSFTAVFDSISFMISSRDFSFSLLMNLEIFSKTALQAILEPSLLYSAEPAPSLTICKTHPFSHEFISKSSSRKVPF